MPYQFEYFDQLYANSDDPWKYGLRWYEQRKRDICMALLLKPIYSNVLEIGCANGFLSQQLADRSQRLLCVDAHATAVQLTKTRLSATSHAAVAQIDVSYQYPQDHYDLIVLSEMGYYLSAIELLQLITHIQNSLVRGGSLLSCHWRYPVQGYTLNGVWVHAVLKRTLTINHYLALSDADFLVDLWTFQKETLAQQDQHL